MFEVECEPFNFFGGWGGDLHSMRALMVGNPCSNLRIANSGVYWFVDSPLSEHYEKKLRDEKMWKKKMKTALKLQQSR